MSPLAKLTLTLFLLHVAACSLPVNADSLVSDISESQIAITSNFTGKRLVLFGAISRATTDQPDNISDDAIRDVIVVIRGPREDLIVRKKERVAGVWVNTDGVEFEDIPSYYFIASSRDFETIAEPIVYRRNGLGPRNLRFKPTVDNLSPDQRIEYQEAIIRNLEDKGLFFEVAGGVQFLDQTLFRTTVDLPANVPDGTYSTKVYLLKGGKVVSVQSKPLYINKTGLERSIFEFAQDDPLAYGVLAVLFAFLAGWLASLMFRQD